MSLYKRFFGSRADRRGTDAELTVDLDLDFSEYVEGIREALAAFVAHARKAGLDAPVPTAPEWTVRQLLAHQGMVHRWATGTSWAASPTRGTTRPRGWRAGPGDLAARRRARPDQGAAERAPRPRGAGLPEERAGPRQFWARRQCHETTIHSVDARGARSAGCPGRRTPR